MTDEDVDYVTCSKCRALVPLGRECPRCVRLKALRVERFGAIVTSRDARRNERKGRGRLL